MDSKASGGAGSSLTVLDHRTGKQHTIPVSPSGIMSAASLKSITSGGDGAGLRVYDPGYQVTAAASSSISHTHPTTHVTHYRGIPMHELCHNRCSFLETAHLLIYGHLPTAPELAAFEQFVSSHSVLPVYVTNVINAMPSSAHPMTLLMAGLTALGGGYPGQNPAVAGQNVYKSAEIQDQQIARLLGKVSTLAAVIYHKCHNSHPTAPQTTRDYVTNMLFMIQADGRMDYTPNPLIVSVLERLFVLLADDELCCSTAAVRHLASSGVDVFTAVSGGVGALAGVLDGAAQEAVINMLHNIGTVDNVTDYLQKVKAGSAALYGFTGTDSSKAAAMRHLLSELAPLTADDRIYQVAITLQAAVAADPTLSISRTPLKPSVDFYTALIIRGLCFTPQFGSVLVAVARMSGWCAHWRESLSDPDTKIARPQQDYRGHWIRHYRSLKVRDQQSPQVPESWSPQVPEQWAPRVTKTWSLQIPDGGRDQQVLLMSATAGTMGDNSSSSSSYYRSLSNSSKALAGTAVFHSSSSSSSSSSSCLRDKLDSATLRIPGWSPVVPEAGSSCSSCHLGVLDQLGSVRIDIPTATAATAAAGSSTDRPSSYYRMLQNTGSSHNAAGITAAAAAAGGGSVASRSNLAASPNGLMMPKHLGIMRADTSATVTATANNSSSGSGGGDAGHSDSVYYRRLQQTCERTANVADITKASSSVEHATAAAASSAATDKSRTNSRSLLEGDSSYFRQLQVSGSSRQTF